MIYTHVRNPQGFHALQKTFLHRTGTRSFAEGQLLLLTGELAIRFLAAHSMGGTQKYNMLWKTLRSTCAHIQLEWKRSHESGLLTIKDCPLAIYFCVLQVGVFNSWVVVWHKNLLEKLNGESALPHATISNHHQLVRGEVFAGNGTCSHASRVLNLLEKETTSDHSLATKRETCTRQLLLGTWEVRMNSTTGHQGIFSALSPPYPNPNSRSFWPWAGHLPSPTALSYPRHADSPTAVARLLLLLSKGMTNCHQMPVCKFYHLSTFPIGPRPTQLYQNHPGSTQMSSFR